MQTPRCPIGRNHPGDLELDRDGVQSLCLPALTERYGVEESISILAGEGRRELGRRKNLAERQNGYSLRKIGQIVSIFPARLRDWSAMDYRGPKSVSLLHAIKRTQCGFTVVLEKHSHALGYPVLPLRRKP